MRGRRLIGLLVAALLTVAMAGAATAVNQEGSGDDPPVLTTLSGTLTRDGEHYVLDGTEVGFGPAWYITAVDASTDYDGDGTVETIAAELDGLVGATVTLEGEAGRCGDFDAFAINGAPYRATTGGPPPWAGGPKKLGVLHPGSRGADNADEDDGGAGRPPWAGIGRPPWAGTGQGKPCS